MEKGKVIIGGLVAAGAVFGLSKLIQGKAPPLSPANIEITDLSINPSVVNPGDKVTIRCIVTNIGETAGSYEVVLEGDFTMAKTVTLNPGESQIVSFQVTPTEVGLYNVTVDGLSSGFRVTEAPVANIVLSDLNINPKECHVGDIVTITVLATNVGEAPGSRTIADPQVG